MLSFVKINESGGVWANRDKAIEYLDAGYRVYENETCGKELTRDELEEMSESESGGEASSEVVVYGSAEAQG